MEHHCHTDNSSKYFGLHEAGISLCLRARIYIIQMLSTTNLVQIWLY